MMGAGVGSLVLGRMVDRFGFFRIAVAGAIATIVGMALAGQAIELLTLHHAFGLLVGGLSQAAFFSPITAESSRWFSRHRSRLLLRPAVRVWAPKFDTSRTVFGR
jgi:MFS family permease